MNLDQMLNTAVKQRVVIVQADHEASLKTMNAAGELGIADFILLGNRTRIKQKALDLKISLDGVEIISAESDEDASSMAANMAKSGKIDIVMKGLVHTSVFTRALLAKDKHLISPEALISHVGLFELPFLPHPVILSDAAININPDLNDKKKILNNALKLSRTLGVLSPKAACIAPVEKVNPKIQSTVDAHELSSTDFGDAVVEGPMALDVAFSREAADIKGIDSQLAGEPDILLFPELNSANAVYKALCLHPGCRSGGILGGLKIPVVLTSRAESDETRLISLKMAISGSQSARQ